MSQSASMALPAPALVQQASEDKWQREYEAFVRLKPELLASHGGSYVVVHNGQVIDSGPDDVDLALRFFAQHGNVPVHIGLVSNQPQPVARIPHYREAPRGVER